MTKDRIAERLEAAGLSTERFIQCQPGEKASVDHTQLEPDRVSGNYGIYATADDALVILDIDDYDDLEDTSGLSALSRLPVTLEQGSPHGGTHRFYAVEPDADGRMIAEVFKDEFDLSKGNPKPSWGEVRVANQYVVGAGSQLDGCDKDECDECATDDGGRYILQNDHEIATVEPGTLVDVLRKDPNYSTDGDEESADTTSDEALQPRGDVDHREILKYALTESDDDKLQRLWNGDYSDYDGDRSEAESALAYKLAFWLQGDETAVRRAMNGKIVPEGVGTPNLQKWNERDDSSYRDSVLRAVKKQTEYYDPSSSSNPSPGEIDWSEVDRGEAILRTQTSPTSPAGELTHQNGCYGIEWVNTNDDGEIIDSGFDVIANFTLETLAFVDTYEGTKMHLRVHPASPMEEPYEVRVHPTAFNEPSEFREQVVRGRTTYFQAQRKPARQILSELRRTVGQQPAPEHEGTEFIGLHGTNYDELVTPTGTLGPDGWKDEPSYVHYEKGGTQDEETSLQQKWALDPDGGSSFDRETVQKICELVPQTRKPERLLPVLSWFYAAPLKPLIQREFGEGEFNLLQVSGITGTGKTTTLELFYELLGGEPDPFDCNDTAFTIEKKFASSCGFPIWLDEYKPTDMSTRALKRLHRNLRGVTRGRVLPKGTASLGEMTYELRAPVVLSGEQTVEEPAVRRRTVMTNFSKESTSGEYRRAFCELAGVAYTDEHGNDRYPDGVDLKQHAIAYYQHVLQSDTGSLEEKWHDARERAGELLNRLSFDLGETEQQGIQTVIFGYEVFKDFADQMGADLSELPGEDALQGAVKHVAENVGPDGRRREHVDEFMELMSLATSAGYLRDGVHYRTLESQNWETEVLAFHMPSTFSEVKKYAQEYNVEDEYSLLNKNDYIDNFKDKIESGGSYALKVNHKVRCVENGTKAVIVDPDRAAEKIPDGFEKTAFVDEAEELETDEIDATAIAELDTEADRFNPYVTVTVKVNVWDAGPDRGPAEKGVVQDATGTVDVVDFFGCDASANIEEGGYYVIEDAKVGTYDGAIQLEIVRETTEVQEIQPGVGHTAAGDTAEIQQADAATDGGTHPGTQAWLNETDTESESGGTEPDVGDTDPGGETPEDAEGLRADGERLVDLLKQRGVPLDENKIIVEASANENLMDPERAKDALAWAKTNGKVQLVDGGYEPT